MPHKLLLADDSVTIQRVIELTFAEEDVEVVVAGNGRQAIERVQSERPDIVLADVGMPERDGYEVAAFIKGDPRLASIPVLLLAGAFEPLDENRARSVGCDGVLVKPFEPQLVINRVKELLARRNDVPADTVDADRGLELPIEPELAAVAAAQSPGDGGADSLEDYFDRLDAAFANIGTPAPRPTPAVGTDVLAGLAELDEPPPVRQPPGGGELLAGWDPDLVAGLAPARQPSLASTFAALLAEEQGEPMPYAVADLAFAPPPPLPEEAIEEITQRVVARMADDSMRRLVLETAERLVREEIDRIKRMSGSAEPQPGA